MVCSKTTTSITIYQCRLTRIRTWISNHLHSLIWDAYSKTSTGLELWPKISWGDLILEFLLILKPLPKALYDGKGWSDQCWAKANSICGLTHWGRVTHICIGKLTIIGSDNGLLPGRRQAIIWPNAGILSTGPLGTNFSEILIEINTFSFKKMHLKMSSGKWRPFVSASMC